MKTLFEELKKRVSLGKDCVLVTVVADSGSVPRGAGARMLVDSGGRVCGTIGGGAVEYRSQAVAAEVLTEKSSRSRSFTLRRNDVEDLGMICGGDVRVYFQHIPGGDLDALGLADDALSALDRDEDAWLITDITDEESRKMAVCSRGSAGFSDITAHEYEKLFHSGVVQAEISGRRYFSEPLVCSGRVVVFGGGHIAQELVPLLAHLDFKCVVFEDRPDYVRPELFPGAFEIIQGDFENIAANVRITKNDYVVVVTRGHAFDYVVQKQVLMNPAAYVGVIGSRAKKAAVESKLRAEGISDELLKTIRSPVGLPIKAKTPAEIAVSIAAELIEVRAGRMEAGG